MSLRVVHPTVLKEGDWVNVWYRNWGYADARVEYVMGRRARLSVRNGPDGFRLVWRPFSQITITTDDSRMSDSVAKGKEEQQ